MTITALQISKLSKYYPIGELDAYPTLREAIVNTTRRWFGDANAIKKERGIWALKDVSLEIPVGQVLGIIGPNGSGKSTLLKIISGITDPTQGHADIYGRLASLLEVGTGFHQELTGRENIFMNGAILGMTHAEIRKKFDDIVEFSEIGAFLDTPVKRYSSGMYTRLAFAVAAHLEPEVLIVDEVLAVGDAAFQKKCLGKMSEVAEQGRTVLFVSHNMASVQSLCSRVIRLHQGEVVDDGQPQAVITEYLEASSSVHPVALDERLDRGGEGPARLQEVRVERSDGDGTLRCSSRLRIRLRYKSDGPLMFARFVVSVYDLTHVGLFILDSDASGPLPETMPAEGWVSCTTEPINLTPGRCYVNLRITCSGGTSDYVQQATTFDVEADDFFGTGRLPTRDWSVGLLHNTWTAREDAAE